MDKKIMQVLQSTGAAGTIWNVVDILKATPEEFQECFDLALEMQNKDLAKLLYSLYPSRIMIEMTLVGATALQYNSGGARSGTSDLR